MLRGEWRGMCSPHVTCRTQHWPSIQQFQDVPRVLTTCIAMPHSLQKDSQHPSTFVISGTCFIHNSFLVRWNIIGVIGRCWKLEKKHVKFENNIFWGCEILIFVVIFLPPRCHRRRGHRGCPSTQLQHLRLKAWVFPCFFPIKHGDFLKNDP